MSTAADGTGRELTFIEAARRGQIVQAAIDTIAEVGYARASLARIGARVGISKGLIGYHFAGKDDLIQQVVAEVLAEGRAYMEPRILGGSSGPEVLKAYIESNLEFMRDHRNHMAALVEIILNGVSADGQRRFYSDADADEAVRDLKRLLARYQKSGELGPDFDPRVMAVALRAAIDAVPCRLIREPDLDVDHYASEIARMFDLATRPRP